MPCPGGNGRGGPGGDHERHGVIRAAQAAVENVKAVIQADQAIVENAGIQLGYTIIRAPMAARTGNLLVQIGSTVKARDDTAQPLVLNQIQPIYVTFSVPEQYLAEIRKFVRPVRSGPSVLRGQERRPHRES